MGKSFIKGALILTVAGILGKLLGAIYRIPFNRIAGEEAAGLYGLCYPVYTFLLALSTAGIPLAVSKLVAEREEFGDAPGSKRIFYLTLTTLLLIGLRGIFQVRLMVCVPLEYQSKQFENHHLYKFL